jgi:hypothetical protein
VPPISRIVVASERPRITDSTSDGAYSVTPIDRPRCSWNNRLVKLRVRESKRRSRYS